LSFLTVGRKIINYLSSTECAVVLFLVIAVVAIPGTIVEKSTYYKSIYFILLLAIFSLNLILCSIKRYKTISKPVLVLHGGVVLTILGCIMTSLGFVATVNMHEGTLSDGLYRWDLNKEVSIGVNLFIKKINMQFLPMPVRVGVLKGEKKEALFELKTGESFDFAGYRVLVGEPEYTSENLQLNIFESNNPIGKYNTLTGETNLPDNFPYKFILVAHKAPVVKRLWVDLELFKGQTKVAEGSTEINHPFKWGGLYFYNTKFDLDEKGRAYAGIQVVRDPGRPIVFAGFTIIALGAVMSFKRRFDKNSVITG
jgi:hypothetical protein